MANLKSDFSTFWKKPSYDQGFTVGEYSYVAAENALLAYVTGAAMPKTPVSTVATFDDIFPGWNSVRARTSTLTYEAFEGGNVYVNSGSDFLGTYSYSATSGLELDLTIPTALKGKGLGSEIFNKAIKETGATKITATWLESDGYDLGLSDNLAAYRGALKTFGTQNAAWQTWTGRQAAKHGFNEVSVTNIRGGVRAIFKK